MPQRISRREFVAKSAAAAVVTAFDPVARAWVADAPASTCGAQITVPHLDGMLTVDPTRLAEAADDFGHIISRSPRAVLIPGSREDIRRIVKFANQNDLAVTMRGQAHSVFGQAQADCGVVIDSRPLDRIRFAGNDTIAAEAGATWRQVTLAALERGLSPLVLADYLDLSVGGVLSVGGIGGASHHFGLVVDNCIELTVVTGDAKLVTCSLDGHADLFESVLGGLGQFAIIVEARIRLASAAAQARIYQLAYGDLATYLTDQRRAVADERFDFLEGQVVPNPRGGWLFVLEGGAYYSAPDIPDDAALIGDLHPLPNPTISDVPYFAWLDRVTPFVDFWKSIGRWATPHPWSDLFLPDSAVGPWVADVLAGLTPQDVGAGVVLFYPFKRSRLTRPFVRVPDEETLWLFDILRFPPPDPSLVAHQLTDNRTLFESARAIGGKRYPISAVEFSQADWVDHYGSAWSSFVALNARFDPLGVLTPGQGIAGD